MTFNTLTKHSKLCRDGNNTHNKHRWHHSATGVEKVEIEPITLMTTKIYILIQPSICMVHSRNCTVSSLYSFESGNMIVQLMYYGML